MRPWIFNRLDSVQTEHFCSPAVHALLDKEGGKYFSNIDSKIIFFPGPFPNVFRCCWPTKACSVNGIRRVCE